jgi:hypothetical protein
MRDPGGQTTHGSKPFRTGNLLLGLFRHFLRGEDRPHHPVEGGAELPDLVPRGLVGPQTEVARSDLLGDGRKAPEGTHHGPVHQ